MDTPAERGSVGPPGESCSDGLHAERDAALTQAVLCLLDWLLLARRRASSSVARIAGRRWECAFDTISEVDGGETGHTDTTT